MIELPKRLLKEKLRHEICCNIALLALALNSTGTLKKSGACECLWYLGHVNYIILIYLGHSQLVVRLLVSELVGWLWWMKWIRKRDQHPPWCGRCLNSQFNWRRCTFQFPGRYFKFFCLHRLPPQKKCQFSTKSLLVCPAKMSPNLLPSYNPPTPQKQRHKLTQPQTTSGEGDSKMIIQKFQLEESSTDYSLAKADQEDVVRSVKSQSVASQVWTSSIHQAKMVGLNIKSVVKIQG